MKKFYFILLTVFLISCSKDDDSSSSAIAINPPAWVQGSWAYADSEDQEPIFKITSNDVIFVVNTTEMSYKGQLEGMAKSGAEVSVDEVISDDSYEVTFDLSQGVTQSFSFTKIDDSTINWDNTGMAIELKKQ